MSESEAAAAPELTGEDIIARRREERRLLKAIVDQKAIELYASFDKNERTAIRFGLHPAHKTLQAERELIELLTRADGIPPDSREVARMLSVAVMDCANRGPEKMVV